MAFKFFMKRPGSEAEKPKIKVTASDKPNIIVEKEQSLKTPQVYAFIDASNLFWGGKESVGFRIDYKKLLSYLQKNFNVTKVFYYGGLRTFEFNYSFEDNKPMDLSAVEIHLQEKEKEANEKDKVLIQKSLNKINFYRLLESYGYIMKIKPAKVFYGEDDEERELPLLKANCDVDMSFDMMRYMQQYRGVVAMTGDGDFAPLLSYLKLHDRTVTVVSRWDRTASEIRQIAGDDFVDFEKLKNVIYLRHY